MVAKIFRIQTAELKLIRRIVRPLVGDRDPTFILVGHVGSSLVEVNYVSLVRRPDVLNVPMDGLPDVRFEILIWKFSSRGDIACDRALGGFRSVEVKPGRARDG